MMPVAAKVATHVVVVGATKGGVGKSTVALNLALALTRRTRAGLLDFDLYAPNIPAMLGIEHTSWVHSWTLASRRHEGDRPRFRPVERYGLPVVSTGFIVGEDQAIGLPERTVELLARQLLTDVAWPALDVLVVDLPPGTPMVHQVLAKVLPMSGAIVVVTPQTVAHVDARKAVTMFRSLKVPVLGGVENMAGVRCAHCGELMRLFPEADPARTIWAHDVDRLVSVEFDPRIAQDSGAPVVVSEPGSQAAQAFTQLGDAVLRKLDA